MHFQSFEPYLSNKSARMYYCLDAEQISSHYYVDDLVSTFQGHSFTTFNLDAHISDVRQLEKAWESTPDMTNALTFFPARDSAYFFMLNKLSCNVSKI